MGLDRHKSLEKATKLLTQGKVPEGVTELRKLANSSADDPLTINRIGDLLARHGQIEDAVRYYSTIGAQFSEGEFLPKAIAIYKKIHRLEPENVEALMRLGTLYLKQKHPGEARAYLLAAADRCLEEKNFDGAREVYERLVLAEPETQAHRARLAEALALAGNPGAACDQLLQLGETLLSRGEELDAERTFRRAAELSPHRPEPQMGISRALARTGREKESLDVLEEAIAPLQDDKDRLVRAQLLGELALRHEQRGAEEAAMAVLKRAEAIDIPYETFTAIFGFHLERGSSPALWSRMAPLFDGWSKTAPAGFLVGLLNKLSEIEDDGHLPALQWLYDVLKIQNDTPGMTQALERLVVAYRENQMFSESEAKLEELKKIAPNSNLFAKEPAAKQSAAAPPASQAAPPPAATPAASGTRLATIDAETPAVPLERAEEAFVSGRMTQAEILEKYGLAAQAIEQLREITDRFPGFVEGQERLVFLLRSETDSQALSCALAGLALAARAAGDTEAAKNAAQEAVELGKLPQEFRDALTRVGLMSDAAPMPGFEPTSSDRAPAKAQPVAAVPETGTEDEDTFIIDFDDAADFMPVQPNVAVAPRQIDLADSIEDEPELEAAAPELELQSQETDGDSDLSVATVEEIQFYLEQGMFSEARARMAELKAAGADGERFDALAIELTAASASADSSSPEPLESATPEVGSDPPLELSLQDDNLDLASDLEQPALVDESPEFVLEMAGDAKTADGTEDLSDDDDLSALTAALESELFDDAFIETPLPDDGAEQSVAEVFAQFREHVAEELESDDFRTHYDLGIAYKEMGLLDEAVEEFKTALESDELRRDAYVMLAKCALDRSETDQAAEWYRQAIGSLNGDEEIGVALRYEYAEVLLSVGNSGEALSVFKDLLEVDPTFRDVQTRVAELEAKSAV